MTTDPSIQGKALVVGANGGMGRAVALALAHQGVELALMGRNGSSEIICSPQRSELNSPGAGTGTRGACDCARWSPTA